MNDMRLPGIGPFSTDALTGPGTEASRDPAQAFDAVMSRFAGDRPRPNATPAQEKARESREPRAPQGPKAAPPDQARAAERPEKGNATEGTTTGGKPVRRTQPEASDDAGEVVTTEATAATIAPAATDPTVLAATAAAAAAAAQAGAPVVPAGAQADATQPLAGDPTQGATMESVPSPLDVLRSQVSPGEGGVAEGSVTDHRTAVTADAGSAVAAPNPAVRRQPATAKDTLRIEAPLMRAMEAVQGEVAARVSAGTNAPARQTSSLATPAQDAAPQMLTAAITAATNVPGTTATYSIAHAAVGAPVGSPLFADELAQRVVMFAGRKLQRADIAVTPADLGPIAVSIEVRGQEATLAFAAASAATRAAIEDALPKLRDMLAAQGLHLAGSHVGSEPRRDAYRSAQGNAGGTASRRSTDAVGAAAPPEAPIVRRRVNVIDIEV